LRQYGGELPIDESVLRERTLTQLINSRLLETVTFEKGYRISDGVLSSRIKEMFTVDGVFDRVRFETNVNAMNMSIPMFEHSLRKNIQGIIKGLETHFTLSLLSGDTNIEQDKIKSLFSQNTAIYFNQSPKDKLNMIKELQSKGDKIMMIGDGLNDAGALKQSNVGIVISDKTNNFSPACDGILDADRFSDLLDHIRYLRFAKYIIYGAFVLAFIYNIIGLSFAITGQLSPIIAAILMPLSSITVIVYGVLGSYLGYQYFYKSVSKSK
jgi:P-type E1-E2 ATPase